MLCNVTCHHDHITNHRAQPSAPDFMFCLCALPADAFLSDHPQNVIGQDCQFQYQLIGLKFAGWQPLHIHIGLDLAMELLTFAVGMVESYDFAVRHSKVCPPGIDFNVAFQKELAIFINGTVYDLVPGTDGDGFFRIIRCFIGNRFPVAADIDGFPFTGSFDILAVFLCHLQPVLFAFPAEVCMTK